MTPPKTTKQTKLILFRKYPEHKYCLSDKLILIKRLGSYQFHMFAIPKPTAEDTRHLPQVVAWLDTSEGSDFLANIVSPAHTTSAL